MKALRKVPEIAEDVNRQAKYGQRGCELFCEKVRKLPELCLEGSQVASMVIAGLGIIMYAVAIGWIFPYSIYQLSFNKNQSHFEKASVMIYANNMSHILEINEFCNFYGFQCAFPNTSDTYGAWSQWSVCNNQRYQMRQRNVCVARANETAGINYHPVFFFVKKKCKPVFIFVKCFCFSIFFQFFFLCMCLTKYKVLEI